MIHECGALPYVGDDIIESKKREIKNEILKSQKDESKLIDELGNLFKKDKLEGVFD